MSRTDLIALLALLISGIAFFSSLRHHREARHLLIIEQRNAAIARLRTIKSRMEGMSIHVEEVLALPLPETTLSTTNRQKLVEFVSDFMGHIELLDISEKALLTTGHTLGRATHAQAVSIKDVLHSVDITVQSTEPLIERCAALLEFSKGIVGPKQRRRRSL